MKNLLPVLALITLPLAASAQTDTLLWNNFETDPTNYMQIAIPLGNATDTSWYTFDVDGLSDGSPSNRPGEWFWSTAFSDNDTIGNTGVLASNSWSNTSSANDNVLITPSIYIGDTNAVLHWKSAPFQTPRYLDGYRILVSTISNDLGQFMDTIFVASEYESLDNSSLPNSFASYTFGPVPTADPMAPFVHGMDGTYTDPNSTTASDSSRLEGRLRPFQLSLAQYSGSTIFIMFEHTSTDDNLLEVDDILVTGTDFTGIHEQQQELAVTLYPNPAHDNVNLRYTLENSTAVTINLYDMNGRLVSSENKGVQSAGAQQATLSVSGIPAGMYRVELVTETGRSNSRVVVQ